MDFLTEYQLQLTDDESGSSNHHLEIAFETEITNRLDFDIRWVWDRIHDPRPSSDGSVPEQDDVRLVVALGFEY